MELMSPDAGKTGMDISARATSASTGFKFAKQTPKGSGRALVAQKLKGFRTPAGLKTYTFLWAKCHSLSMAAGEAGEDIVLFGALRFMLKPFMGDEEKKDGY
jgi:hypothetical protein